MARRRGKNEGSIRQRKDGLWEGALTIGLTEKGNPKRRSVYGKTRAEVAKKLNELLLKHQQGSLPALDRVTVADYLARHLEGKTHIVQKTRSTYQQTINHILRTPIGDVRLQSLRPANVRDCYTALSNRGLAPRSQRKAATFLCSALADAVHEEVITRNPALAVKVKAARVERKERQEADRAYLGDAWTDSGLIFTTALGTVLHPRNLTRSFKRLLNDAKLREIRVHDLRHTYASLALQRGTPVEVVSERLGHSSVGFTLDTYRHLYEAERREAAVSLDDLLGVTAQPRAVN